jgi:hypothetical protein
MAARLHCVKDVSGTKTCTPLQMESKPSMLQKFPSYRLTPTNAAENGSAFQRWSWLPHSVLSAAICRTRVVLGSFFLERL